MLRSPTARTALAALLVAAATLPEPSPARADDALGAATPEALVERLRRAAATRDLVEASRCLAPRARTDMVAGMFVGAMVLVEFAKEAPAMQDQAMLGMVGEDGSMDAAALGEAAKRRAAAEIEAMEISERFDELLARHGLELPEASEGAPLDREEMTRRFLRIDQPAFLADLMAFMKSAADEGEASAPQGAVEIGDLTDLELHGTESATASLGGRPIELVRLDGRWFFSSTDAMKPGPPRAEG